MSAGHWMMRIPPDDDDYVAPSFVLLVILGLVVALALGCAAP